MKHKPILYTVDEYGVRNYKTKYLVVMSFGILYLSITILAWFLLMAESSQPDANIANYSDAFWTLMMSASTIGFGDFYPTTLLGRVIVALMFYIGVGIVGFIGAMFADRVLGFADTSIKNRELRLQNEEILAHNKVLEKKLDTLVLQIGQMMSSPPDKPKN